MKPLRIFLILIPLFATACGGEKPAQGDTPTPDQAAQGFPQGLTPHQPTDPAMARQRDTLLKTLRSHPYRIEDERVLQALAAIPREEFCLDRYQGKAYANRPLPIGWDQTISQPYIVALMTEKLEPQSTDRVLEIGTGSGYQAAVLSPLVQHVYSIEIIEPLAEQAKSRLDRLGYDNVSTRMGDGYLGWPEHAPFDAIIVTCAPDDIPQPLIDQLAEGGRMMIPVGKLGNQRLVLLEKRGGRVEQKEVLRVSFVPMTGRAQEGEVER